MKLGVAFRELLPEPVVLELDRAYARIRGAWNVEHRDDGRHSDIRCASIAERERVNAMGEWQSVPYNPSNFSANGSMVWSVGAANVATYQYMLIGDTMFLDFDIFDTSVGGATSTQLRIAVPDGYGIHFLRSTPVWVVDNGVGRIGFCQALDSTKYLTIYADPSATLAWTASASQTRVAGQIHFKIQPTGR